MSTPTTKTKKPAPAKTTVVVEATTPKPKKKPAPKSPAKLVDMIEEGGIKQLHLISEKLRRHFLSSGIGYDMVSYASLYDSDDTAKIKAKKDRFARFRLTNWLISAEIKKFVNNNPSADEMRGDPGKTVREAYGQFLEIYNRELKILKAEVQDAWAKGMLTFEQLTMALGGDVNPVREAHYFEDDDDNEITKTSNEPLLLAMSQDEAIVCVEVKSAKVVEGWSGVALRVEGSVYGWDGRGISKGTHRFAISMYEGEKSFKDLGIIVIDETLKTTLVERGRRHIELNRKPSYMSYTGHVVQRFWYGDKRFNAQGRVMVDIVGMHRNEQDYQGWFGGIQPNSTRDGRISKLGEDEITEKVLICMSPWVYGFSFVSKHWGDIRIDQLSEINFRLDAWDKLVLPQNDKDMIRALVSAESLHSVDLIEGKGGGVIFLLAGEPGGGKTLTAESVSEVLQRPLYAAGIGELGTNVEALEENLTRILDTAASWKAVLLLDEADIFLEERNDNDVHRNAMVGVFLRLLEYYPGIMFLTSNRAKRIDRAFYSRISLALHYSALGQDARVQVWKNLMSKQSAEKVNLNDADYSKLASFQLNGRQIKNVIRIGITLGAEHNRPAVLDDFTGVIARVEAFDIANK